MRLGKSTISRKSIVGMAGISLLASAAAGCSSDVMRFENAGYANSDQITTASVPNSGPALRPMADVGQGGQTTQASSNQSGGNTMAQPFPAAVPDSSQDGSYEGMHAASANRAAVGSVQGSPLPPVSAQPAAARSMDAGRPAPRQDARRPAGWSSDGGSRVTLRSGETLATISRRYGVPADAIAKANGISDPSSVGSGSTIVIPRYSNGDAVATTRPQPAGAENRQADEMQKSAQRVKNTASGSTYIVQSGDSLSRIARKANVSIDALKAENGLSGSAIRIGQSLRLPSGAEAPAATEVASADPTDVEAVKTRPVDKKTDAKSEPAQSEPAKAESAESKPAKYKTPAKAEKSVADAQAQTEVASVSPETSGLGKLRWPVQGQIVSKFGSQRDGNRNDGIDISVPEGTPVKAAENGVVIYAGNGLKEYGNTVLVRHDDGMVTVYGYAKDLKVSRGDKVKRGMVIADSGMSGAASRPKLHFEVRKDATPVDPSGYLN